MSEDKQTPAAAPQRVTLLESDLQKWLMSGWLSPRTSYSLRIDGPFTSRECAALLRMLSVQLEVMDLAPQPPQGGSEGGA